MFSYDSLIFCRSFLYISVSSGSSIMEQLTLLRILCCSIYNCLMRVCGDTLLCQCSASWCFYCPIVRFICYFGLIFSVFLRGSRLTVLILAYPLVRSPQWGVWPTTTPLTRASLYSLLYVIASLVNVVSWNVRGMGDATKLFRMADLWLHWSMDLWDGVGNGGLKNTLLCGFCCLFLVLLHTICTPLSTAA